MRAEIGATSWRTASLEGVTRVILCEDSFMPYFREASYGPSSTIGSFPLLKGIQRQFERDELDREQILSRIHISLSETSLKASREN